MNTLEPAMTPISSKLDHTSVSAAALTSCLVFVAACGGSRAHYRSTSTVSATSDGVAMESEAAADYSSSPIDDAPSSDSAGGGYSVATAGAAPLSVGADYDESGAWMAPPSAGAAADEAGRMEVTTRTTTTVTVSVEPSPVEPQQLRQPARMLTAATVSDHDRRGNYLQYLQRHPYEARRLGLDMSSRIRFRVVDAAGRPVNDASVRVHASRHGLSGQVDEFFGRTHADGVWDLFPAVHGYGSRFQQGRVVVEALGMRGTADVYLLPPQGDGQDIVLRLDQVRAPATRALDLAFMIDVTGSMEDELRFVNREVADIVARVRAEVPEASVRVGAVFYRDRNDTPALQRIAFSGDVAGFARAMTSVHASGGGDYPEDMHAGLHQALAGLGWRSGNVARVLVAIADAPPKNYGTGFGHREAMLHASRAGIRLLPVAASGADREVEFLFRAMGAATSTPYVYLTDDSGLGNPHMEADTDRVAVEYFHDLLTRMVIDDIHGRGMHEAM